MEQSERGKSNKWYPKLTPFGKWVAGRVRLLATGGRSPSGIIVEGYVQGGSYATAALAKLRRSAGHEVGSDPDVFEWILLDVDDPGVSGWYSFGAGENPTPEELAAHAAITLFAMHQQSIHEASMHTDEWISLGRAVGHMAYGNFNSAGIQSMYDRLQTASSWKEMVRHARSLVKLLKRERIPLNYGLLAQDLLKLQSTREPANHVRLQWGRDFQSAWNIQAKAANKANAE